jgi:hypothetical protein
MKQLITLVMLMIISSAFASSSDSLRINYRTRDVNWRADSLGQISLIVTGGSPPYTVTWADDPENSSIRKNLFAKEYSVRVDDASGHIATKKIPIRFQQEVWKKQGRINDSLLGVEDSMSTMLFRNSITQGTSGFIEYRAKDLRGEVTYGLQTDTTLVSTPEYAFYHHRNKLFIIMNGKIAGSYGKLKNDDVLHSSVIPDKTLYSSLNVKHTRFNKEILTSDFNKPLNVELIQNDRSCTENTKGSIDVIPKGGYGPYEIRTYQGNEVNESKLVNRTQLENSQYLVEVKDHRAKTIRLDADIANKVAWESSPDYRSEGSSLRKQSSEGWCNSRVLSSSRFDPGASGWLEFTVPDSSSRLFAGISNAKEQTTQLIYEGVYVQNSELYIIQIDQDGGFSKELIKRILPGDKIRFSIVSDTIYYSVNKEQLYSIPRVFTGLASIEVRMFNSNAMLSSLRTSFNCIQ